MTYFEERNSHFYVESLGFIAARYGTTIVVGEHNDRLPVEIGSEYPFTRDKKVVAVGQRIHRGQTFFMT
jgi:hypothetical protein